MIRLLGRPVPEARAITARHGRDLELPGHPAQLLLLKLLADSTRTQEQIGSLRERLYRIEQLDGAAT